jgi:hypothetical protein
VCLFTVSSFHKKQRFIGRSKHVNLDVCKDWSRTFLRANYVCIAIFLVAGCTTTASVEQSPSEKDSVYLLKQDCNTVLTALPYALVSINLELRRNNSSGADCPATVIARKGISAFSWGEIVRINLARTEAGGTELRVYTERALATNVTARGDWSPQVYTALLAQLTGSDS